MRSAMALIAALLGCLCACGDDRPARPDTSRDVDEQLLEAAYRNDVAAARRLISQGADVNAKDGTQQSAYLIATSEVGDDPRLLKLTLDAGADVGARTVTTARD